MNNEIKKTAILQYLSYFKIWFIILLFFIGGLIVYLTNRKNHTSINSNAPQERVYDYADVLTLEEEELLRQQIQDSESKYGIHIVLVTENKYIPVGEEYLARDIADDFYDTNNYGYNRIHGDGLLLYDFCAGKGDSYAWLSTCGKVENKFSTDDIDSVLDEVYDSNYSCYANAIRRACDIVSNDGILGNPILFPIILVIGIVSGLVFAGVNSVQKKAQVTTNNRTYLSDTPKITYQKDQYLRKHVTSRKIETSSGGGGGGGGHHVSRSGVSHGGGGRRH